MSRFTPGDDYDAQVRAWADERGLPWWPVVRVQPSGPARDNAKGIRHLAAVASSSEPAGSFQGSELDGVAAPASRPRPGTPVVTAVPRRDPTSP